MSRTILGEDDAGEFKLDIPDDSSLTFGPNAPYAAKSTNYASSKDGWSLRIYEGAAKSKLLACMTNVKWFRETSIKVSRVVEKIVAETVYKDDDGNYESHHTVVKSKQLLEHSDDGMGLQNAKSVNTPNNKTRKVK